MRVRGSLLAAEVGALLAVVVAITDPGPWTWAATRAAGYLALLALTGSTVLGLLMSTNRVPPGPDRARVVDLHSAVSVVALVLLGLHLATLAVDGAMPFSPGELTVPFLADYRRLWTGLGVAAAWLTVAAAASFWLRLRLGARRWRRLHTIAFGAWYLAMIHGLRAGTDSDLPWVFLTYLLCATVVAALTALRLAVSWRTRPGEGRSRPGASGQAPSRPSLAPDSRAR